MNHPFQCIATVRPLKSNPISNEFLLAACGPKLVSVCLTTGIIAAEWTAAVKPGQEAGPAGSLNGGDENEERPSKKQKTMPAQATLPNVMKLTISPDHRHAVAVTDDKCVRVFQVQEDGKLVELSQRFMPKRPCAIQVLPDNLTILCGDKFGDVYSLPLIRELQQQGTNISSGPEESESMTARAKPFKPTATNLTVHTQRNRKALQAQLNQKNQSSKQKEPLKFEHRLLLGHVSMLTDLAYGTSRSRWYGKRLYHNSGSRRTYPNLEGPTSVLCH